jgi:hypothetical protein
MPEGQLHIKTFLWRGQLRYRCPHCVYDSYILHGREGLLLHIARSHKEQKASKPPANFPTLFDASGREVEQDKPIVGEDSVTRVLRASGLLDREIVVEEEA